IILLFITIIGVAKSREENCKCGWDNPSRIVNGVETEINEFPMVARLIYPSPGMYCGGTIITPQHIVTAAHCLQKYKRTNYTGIHVVVGEHDYTTDTETNVTKRYTIAEVTIHPNYNSHNNDIAIVKTNERFEYSMKVGPVCLPFNYMTRNLTNETVTALGWGKLRYNGQNSKVLRKVDLHVITREQCETHYGAAIANANLLCTFDVGRDACQNDSGGPILWRSPTTDNLILVGVVNFGRTCADDAPGGNARVTSFMEFIHNATIGETYCKAD
ncbi:PREDICTED: venom serine protease, partial [Polistes dominula]